MRLILIVIFVAILSATSACTIHRIDVQQGNVITKEMVDQLKSGMTKRQVLFVMGSPMIEDPFHGGRWDYVFTLQPGNTRKITEYKRVTVLFKNDTVADIDVQNVN
jgi:outer membrane protein assembly factor BamE